MVERSCKLTTFIGMKYQAAKFVSGRIGIFYSSLLQRKWHLSGGEFKGVVSDVIRAARK